MRKLGLSLCLAVASLAQEKPPAFDVASIKPSPPPAPGRTRPANDPMLYAARNQTLKQLVQRAYELEDYQVSGGPGWTETDRYDIDAKPASPSTPAQLLSMLRSLLAERFQLTFHKDTKPVELNVLTVAKGGPKFGQRFSESKAGDAPPSSGKPVPSQLSFLNVTIKGFTTYLRMNMSRDPATGHTVSLQDIAPILDQTGLTGKYDITLDIGALEEWPALLEHQIGLTVGLRRTPVEVLVIDGAAKPEVQ